MNILIQNYNTNFSTEATYFNHALVSVEAQSFLWEPSQISAFDIFDRVNPDIFITKYDNLNTDIIKVMSGSKCKIVINVSGIQENEARSLEETLEENKIKCEFCFYNNKKPKGFKKTKLVQIMSAADVFLPRILNYDFQLPYAVVSDCEISKEATDKLGGVYHKIGIGGAKQDCFDISYNIIDMSRYTHIYKNILLVSDTPEVVCGQPFFDFSLKAPPNGKCAVHLTDRNSKMVGDFMLKIFDDVDIPKTQMNKYIKSTIWRKHTALNRTERLMKNLGDEDTCNKIRTMRDKLISQAEEMAKEVEA